MKIFNILNIFGKNNAVNELNSSNQVRRNNNLNPDIYTGDYSSLFRFNLDKTINPKVGQNLYYLS